MVADKISARLGFDRISEGTLYATAFLGGFAGTILIGLCIHQKTSKDKFWFSVGLATILWILFLAVYFSPGLIQF